jgi:hypothetical protein
MFETAGRRRMALVFALLGVSGLAQAQSVGPMSKVRGSREWLAHRLAMSPRQLGWAILMLALSSASAAAQFDSTISAQGIGGISLCQPLTAVRDRLPGTRDTLIESEGQKWPAKVVPLARGGILFEASWIDTTHVWRVTTTSPRYRTPHGYHVGMTLGDLLDRHEQLRFAYEEGYIVITLVSDQVDVLPDDATVREFLSRSPSAYDSLEALPRSARIKAVVVSGTCPH